MSVVVDVLIIASGLAGAAALAAALAGPRQPRLCLILLAAALAAGGLAWGDARMRATAPLPLGEGGEVSGLIRVDPSAHPGPGARLTATAVDLRDGSGPLPRGLRVILSTPPRSGAPEPGALLRVEGRIQSASGEGDPGWWRRHLERRRISGRLSATSLEQAGRHQGSTSGRWRIWAQSEIAARIAGERGAVVRGLSLGGGVGLSESTSQEFRDAGIWHLLAVSGQNVTAVAIALLAMARGLGLPRRIGIGLGAGGVVVYALACDGGPSVGRAVVVGLVVLLTQFVGRWGAPWYVLLFALVCLLAYQPRAIHDPGLHLSFAAVGGLLILSPRIDQVARGWLPRPLATLLAASLGAALATAPVLAFHFGRLSLVGIAVNIVAVPLAAPVVILALVGLVADALVAGAGRPFSGAAAAGAEVLIVLSHHASRMPSAAVEVPRWSAVPLAAVAGGVLVALRRGHGRVVAWISALACGLWLGVALTTGGPSPWPTTAEMAVLDVGQGQSVLLRDPAGGAILVDVGPPGSPSAIRGALRRLGVTRIDLLVLTHGARDQAGALPDVLEVAEVRRAVHGPFGRGEGEADGLDAVDLLREEDVPVNLAAAGDRLTVGAWSLDVLWPPRVTALTTPANDRSLVVVARANTSVALIASDAEGHVLRRAPLPRADTLVVAHHGSDDPDLPVVLERVGPDVALISVGADNGHGHPAPSTLAALAAARVEVRRTDEDGDLFVAPR